MTFLKGILGLGGFGPIWRAIRTELKRRLAEAEVEFRDGQKKIWDEAEASERVLLNQIARTILKGE